MSLDLGLLRQRVELHRQDTYTLDDLRRVFAQLDLVADQADRLRTRLAKTAYLFWLDCRAEGYTGPRGADHCAFEGTKVCARCELADAYVRIRTLESQGNGGSP